MTPLFPENPKHGEIAERVIPETVRRARWCAPCGQWTWERGSYGSGKFYHGGKHGYGRRPCQTREAT